MLLSASLAQGQSAECCRTEPGWGCSWQGMCPPHISSQGRASGSCQQRFWGSRSCPQGSRHHCVRFLAQRRALCSSCFSWVASQAGPWMLSDSRGTTGCQQGAPLGWMEPMWDISALVRGAAGFSTAFSVHRGGFCSQFSRQFPLGFTRIRLLPPHSCSLA